MERQEIQSQLNQKVKDGWSAYVDKLLKLTSSEVISLADEISATSFCHDRLINCDSQPDHLLEYLLQFDDPLEVMREHWQEDRPDHSEDFDHALWSLWNYGLGPEESPDQGMTMK